MKILYTGTDKRCKEFEDKFSTSGFDLLRFNFTEFQSINLKIFDAIFDLNFDDHQDRFAHYADIKNLPILLGITKSSLLHINSQFPASETSLIFGFCGFPTFINRSVWELTCLGKNAENYFEQLSKNLQIDLIHVSDRVGLVTPRVVFMIINEAYYTLQEKTASKADIDLAMKLGTNYPLGPFEWMNACGVKEVVETLDAVYRDTSDERYRVCPLLRKEYLEYIALKKAIQ